jgi:hypothetical protein
MLRRIARLGSLLVAGALALALVAPASAADTAMVRVMHASPDAPNVDVWVDDAKVLTDVPFGAISDYLPLAAGSHHVVVVQTGTTTPAVIDANVTVEAGKKYTIAATNVVASIAPVILADGPAVDGTAKVRVVHFSPDAPGVDVAPDGAAPIVTNLEFPNATGYLSLAAGSYDLEVRLTGTSTVALQLDPITIESGKAYTVFAIGSAAAEPAGGNALQAKVALDDTALPATDTVATTATSGAAIALVALIGVLGFIGTLRLATVRVRR